MDWVAAKSYYIGYGSLNRFVSLLFIHYYFLSWSIGLIVSLLVLFLFTFVPSSLNTTRTINFLIIGFVCLSNLFSAYFQTHMIIGQGEPNLSFHSCRFIVFISSMAKPLSIYFTLLFSFERLFTKVLSKIFAPTVNYRRIYKLLIILISFIIFSIRLYQILKLIPRSQISNNDTKLSDFDFHENIEDITDNSSDRNVSFQYCFNSMNIYTYAQILSFNILQYWYEYLSFGIIIIILLILLVQQILSRSNLSFNTKLYFTLSLSVILFESILYFLHLIVDDYNNNNDNIQYISLKFMLFIYSFRAILIPLILILINCDPLKQFLRELFIERPYLNNMNENGNMNDLHMLSKRTTNTDYIDNDEPLTD